eukprot:gene4802-biopygen15097
MSLRLSFNQPTYADIHLVLRSSKGGCSTSGDDLASDSPLAKRQCTGLSLDDVCSFYTHKVILAAHSPVINAMLLKAKELRDLQAMDAALSVFLVPMEHSGSIRLIVCPPTRQLTDPQLEVLELPMEQQELLACEVLLRSMYSDDLAGGADSALSSEQGAGVSRVTLLVQVYRLADRLEVCTDQCAQAISAICYEDCESVDVVISVFSLKRSAPALAEHATIKVLMETCLSWLVGCFGDLTCLVDDDDLMEDFKKLDFLTVLAFLESDELGVGSENDVLVFMGVWIGEDWAVRMSKEELKAFWNVLRLGHLTTSFISRLAALVPWLPVDPDVLQHAIEWKMYQTKDPVKVASMQKMLQSVYGSSVAWFKNAREPYFGVWSHEFCFSASCLAELLSLVQHSGVQEDLHVVRAPPGQYNGYDFFPTLSVQLLSDGSKKTFVLSVGFEVRTAACISKGVQTLVHVKAYCGLCRVGNPVSMDKAVHDFIYGTRAWELTRVDTLHDFSSLGNYLHQSGEMKGRLSIYEID